MESSVIADEAAPDHAATRRRRIRRRVAVGSAVIAVAALAVVAVKGNFSGAQERSSQAKYPRGALQVTPAQLANLTIESVTLHSFHAQLVTEGRIALDEDHSTPIFSPYAGRVTRLFVKPGDTVSVGQPLFTVEATDMVQAQNDFISAVASLNKARSALDLAQINDRRQRALYDGKAVPLKEVQNAEAVLDGAENDAHSADIALEAVRNRLRILGKTDQEIKDFQEKGTISPATIISAPIGGTVVQRKVGPGQYVGSGAADPVFVIGDLSTVWVVAYVREADAPMVRVGQPLDFTVVGFPERTFAAKVDYVAAAFDPTSRRLPVRATIDNPDRLLRPEMFATITILASEDTSSPAVPREAIVYEGSDERVWVATSPTSLALRNIKTGLVNGSMVQIVDGLQAGDKVVTRGGVFIDRVAGGGET